MDGNFEASVLLLDTVWDVSLDSRVQGGFVAAAPSRDVLAFGDRSSAQAVEELNGVVSRLEKADGDHLLFTWLYERKNQCWETYSA